MYPVKYLVQYYCWKYEKEKLNKNGFLSIKYKKIIIISVPYLKVLKYIQRMI